MAVELHTVLAPVIFNLFLVAVTLVFKNGLSPAVSIPFKYRLDESIFNLRRLQAQNKVSTDTVYELQYADDAALPSHSPSDLQENLNTLADAYRRAGLIINTKKTEILTPIQHSSPSPQLSFTIHGDVLNTTQQFTYLGRILSSDSDLTNEIQQRVKLASSAFGRLAVRVFFNRNFTVSTKVAVYKAICLSILLYGCESWIPYRQHIKALEAYHVRCL